MSEAGGTPVRGSLEVKPAAVASIVTACANQVDGTVRRGGGPLGVAGTLPKVDVSLRGGRAWVNLEVGASWPCRAETLTQEVRATVREAAERLCSIPIERLDVVLRVVDIREKGGPR